MLAHPLRLRLLEIFAEGPCTPKQAAERLGVPPTRIYHHVAVLERLGIVRVRETRKNRGTTEKHYEAAARGFEMDPASFSRGKSRGARKAAARLAGASATALALRVVERAGDELAEAIEVISDPDLAADDPRRPLALRAGLFGSPEEIVAMRDELLAVLEGWSKKAEAEAKAKAKAKAKGETAKPEARMRAWLTIVFVPEAEAGKGKAKKRGGGKT